MGATHSFFVNGTGYTARVICAPDSDYEILDLFNRLIPISVEGIGKITTMNDLQKIWDKQISMEAAKPVSDFFKTYGVKLDPQVETAKETDMYQIIETNLKNVYSISGWQALTDAKQRSVTVFLEEPDSWKFVQFSADDLTNWIIHNSHVNESDRKNRLKDNGPAIQFKSIK